MRLLLIATAAIVLSDDPASGGEVSGRVSVDATGLPGEYELTAWNQRLPSASRRTRVDEIDPLVLDPALGALRP